MLKKSYFELIYLLNKMFFRLLQGLNNKEFSPILLFIRSFVLYDIGTVSKINKSKATSTKPLTAPATIFITISKYLSISTFSTCSMINSIINPIKNNKAIKIRKKMDKNKTSCVLFKIGNWIERLVIINEDKIEADDKFIILHIFFIMPLLNPIAIIKITKIVIRISIWFTFIILNYLLIVIYNL